MRDRLGFLDGMICSLHVVGDLGSSQFSSCRLWNDIFEG